VRYDKEEDQKGKRKKKAEILKNVKRIEGDKY